MCCLFSPGGSGKKIWLAKVLQQSEAKFNWAKSFWFFHPCFLWMKLCYLEKLHEPPKCWDSENCTVILAGVQTRFILNVDEYCINCLIHQSLGVALRCWAYTDMVPFWISVLMGRPPVLAKRTALLFFLICGVCLPRPRVDSSMLQLENCSLDSLMFDCIMCNWSCLLSGWNLFTFISII